MKIKLACLILLAFHFGAFAQEAAKEPRLKAVYENGRWGYADRRGKVIIAAEFDAARPFADGLAQVGVVDEELPEIAGRPNLKWGYIDERGRVLVELRYAVLRDFSENLAAVALLDAKNPERSFPGRRADRRNLTWGYIDRSGRVVIPVQFLSAGDFSEGLAQVNVGKVGGDGGESSFCGAPSNYGYIDKTGAFVIKPQFARAGSFRNGRARVSIGRVEYMGRCVCCAPRFVGRHGQVDRSGRFIADKSSNDDSSLDFEDREN
ncbi:MAG TPA: WG repeat-containing protein [Pyrinomonadaceae bacterium]|nr:WG repeat-containing protein [Pyrinomonadaceae bacterium]